jgi:AcrR family transcriptional regulator
MGKQRGKRGRRPPATRESSGGSEENRSLALLWGGRERPPRGPKPTLNLDAVVAAAIDVIDAEGLSALTMTRVAERLGVTTMAIYRYVPGKSELVDLATDAALGSPPGPGEGPWRSEIARWARASLARCEERPWRLESAQHRVPIGPNWLAWLDAGLRALADSGLAATEMLNAVMLVDGHVRATAQLSAGAAATQRWTQDFRRVLESALGDPRYPALTRLAEVGGFSDPASETPFEFGLERVLDGIGARVAAQPSRRR